jgi:hypothetical protein
MMIFTYVGLSGATVGTALGALLIVLGFANVDPPQLSDMRFSTGLPLLLGSIVLGILSEISISLRKAAQG